MNRVIVITGPVQSGKTTLLMRIFKDRQDVYGFLCPDLEGQRYFFDLGTKQWMEFEVKGTPDFTDTFTVGKYSFRSEVFSLAKHMIDQAFIHSGSFFIIDEIGKLELKGQGLEPELSKMLHERAPFNKTLILVVRDYLLDEAIIRYNLYDINIIHINDNDELMKLISISSND